MVTPLPRHGSHDPRSLLHSGACHSADGETEAQSWRLGGSRGIHPGTQREAGNTAARTEGNRYRKAGWRAPPGLRSTEPPAAPTPAEAARPPRRPKPAPEGASTVTRARGLRRPPD